MFVCCFVNYKLTLHVFIIIIQAIISSVNSTVFGLNVVTHTKVRGYVSRGLDLDITNSTSAGCVLKVERVPPWFILCAC